jgi:hypothetical protein
VHPDGFFDVHVRGASLDDTAVVTFSFSGDLNGTPVIGFFVPGQGWQQLRSSTLITSTFTVDPVTHIILQGEYQGKSYAGMILDPTTLLVVDRAAHTLTAFFDSSSNPQVTHLHGTVFSVAVPTSQTTTTTVTRDVVSAGNTALATATFVSSSQATLVLNVSQVTDGKASQSEVAAPNRTGEDESDQGDDWLNKLWERPQRTERRQPEKVGKAKPADEAKDPARADASKESKETPDTGKEATRLQEQPKKGAARSKEDAGAEMDDAFLDALDVLFTAPAAPLADNADRIGFEAPIIPEGSAMGLDLRWAFAVTLMGLWRTPELPEERAKTRRPLPA